MNDWQQGFLKKLEAARRTGQEQFQNFADGCLQGAVDEFAEFVIKHGFGFTMPDCDDGTRHYKFALTEDGYVIFIFRVHGLEQVEVFYEIFAPGAGAPSQTTRHTRLRDADERWVEQQLQQGIDRFMTLFLEGAAKAEHAELVAA